MKEFFDEYLDANAPDFFERLMEALGVKPGDSVSITTPQFERTDGMVVPIPAESLERIAKKPVDVLRALGCGAWDEPDENGEVLMLFPYQWYDKIPDGMELWDISGERLRFKHGETDDDYRFGCLAYGVKVKAAKQQPEVGHG